jgi:hypothetical protein
MPSLSLVVPSVSSVTSGEMRCLHPTRQAADRFHRRLARKLSCLPSHKSLTALMCPADVLFANSYSNSNLPRDLISRGVCLSS